jgi:outer membrane lipoprotein SlyB
MSVSNRLGVAVLLTALCAACAAPSSGRYYSRQEARTAWTVTQGEVIDIAPVVIEGEKTWLGTAGGGFVGYELGRAVGGGQGSQIAGAVGAVVGGVSGQAIEENLTRQNGVQISVELDKGETIAIVQADDVTFAEGERVKVLRRRDGAARVVKI